MPKVKNSQRYHHLALPFPPDLSVDDLLEKSRCNNRPGKIPNCFLCYRISWVKHLKKMGMKLDLSEIPSFVSHKWKSERQEVKDFYKKLSNDAKKKHRANNKSRVYTYTTEKPQDEVVNTLTLPFPPDLSVDDFLEKSRCNNRPGKIPNCFLCYRISWVEHLKKMGMKLDLSEIPSFVSRMWQSERQEVKDYYKQLSVDAKRKHRANSESRVSIFHK